MSNTDRPKRMIYGTNGIVASDCAKQMQMELLKQLHDMVTEREILTSRITMATIQKGRLCEVEAVMVTDSGSQHKDKGRIPFSEEITLRVLPIRRNREEEGAEEEQG